MNKSTDWKAETKNWIYRRPEKKKNKAPNLKKNIYIIVMNHKK